MMHHPSLHSSFAPKTTAVVTVILGFGLEMNGTGVMTNRFCRSDQSQAQNNGNKYQDSCHVRVSGVISQMVVVPSSRENLHPVIVGQFYCANKE